jgi:hypothetical protein
MDKSKIKVVMSLEDYEELNNRVNHFRKLYYEVTRAEYIKVIDLNPEPENLEIEFNATKFIQENIESFGEQFEGFWKRVNKVNLK